MAIFRKLVEMFTTSHNYVFFVALVAISVTLFAIKLVFIAVAVILGYGMHAINMLFDSAVAAAKMLRK